MSGNPVTVSKVTTTPDDSTLGAGALIMLDVVLSGIVSVSGGVLMLRLNDGGTATYVSGSGTNTLVFATTVATGQSTADLTVTGVTGGAAVKDLSGTAANLAGAVTNPAGTLAVSAPDTTVTAITAIPSVSGALPWVAFPSVRRTVPGRAAAKLDHARLSDLGTTRLARLGSVSAQKLCALNRSWRSRGSRLSRGSKLTRARLVCRPGIRSASSNSVSS